MWSVWCRALVGALLVALGASLELYDQLPASEDLHYQDDNDIDTGPKMPLPRVPNDVMMRKFIKAMQLQRISERLSDRPHLSPLEEVEHHLSHSPEAGFKEQPAPVFKRLAEVFGGPAPAHRQQKWKIKKGKSLGSQMVCYFKLCAFRSPA